MVVPDLLYHYCNMESFLSIIDSGILRLSDARCTNDNSENIWIMKYIQEELQVIKKDYPDYFSELEKMFCCLEYRLFLILHVFLKMAIC